MGLSPDDAIRSAAYRAFGIAPEDWEPELRAAESRFGNGRVRPFAGLRDLYTHLTGDHEISGRFWARAQEAAMLTTDLPNLLADTMNKKLQVEYNHYPQDWRKWCSIVSVASLSEQDSVQLDDLAALPVVDEGDPYTSVAADEFKASYTPHKYGELVIVTREMILRDDLRGLARLPLANWPRPPRSASTTRCTGWWRTTASSTTPRRCSWIRAIGARTATWRRARWTRTRWPTR